MLKCDVNENPKQCYYNHTLAWVLSCNFAAYLQYTFSQEHHLVAASKKEHFKCGIFQWLLLIYNDNDQSLQKFLLKMLLNMTLKVTYLIKRAFEHILMEKINN